MYRLSFLLMKLLVPKSAGIDSSTASVVVVEKEEEEEEALVAPVATDWPVAGLLNVRLRNDGACRTLLLPVVCFVCRGSLYIFT